MGTNVDRNGPLPDDGWLPFTWPRYRKALTAGGAAALTAAGTLAASGTADWKAWLSGVGGGFLGGSGLTAWIKNTL